MPEPAYTPMAPWRWLQQAIALLRAQPRALLGATSLLLAVALAPLVVQGLLAAASPGLAQVLGTLLSLLVYPPAVAGYFRVLHALAQGQPLRPAGVFAVFQDGPCVRRLVIANLLVTSGALLFLSVLFWFGGDELAAFLRATSQLQPGAQHLPSPPGSLLPLAVVLVLFGAALLTVQGLAFAELALGTRPPLAAIGMALRLLARHFGLLLLFYVPIAVFGFLAFMLVLLVAMLVGMLLSAISPALSSALLLLASLVLALLMYALMFGFFYFAWREWLGELGPPQPPAATHEIAA